MQKLLFQEQIERYEKMQCTLFYMTIWENSLRKQNFSSTPNFTMTELMQNIFFPNIKFKCNPKLRISLVCV